MAATKTPSPEETGRYECPKCGNRRLFTGIDIHGYGGPDACEGCETNVDRSKADDLRHDTPYCSCETTLRQGFTVLSQGETRDDADIDYHVFTGGESDAEIGSYTTIKCRECGATVWTEEG